MDLDQRHVPQADRGVPEPVSYTHLDVYKRQQYSKLQYLLLEKTRTVTTFLYIKNFFQNFHNAYFYGSEIK